MEIQNMGNLVKAEEENIRPDLAIFSLCWRVQDRVIVSQSHVWARPAGPSLYVLDIDKKYLEQLDIYQG